MCDDLQTNQSKKVSQSERSTLNQIKDYLSTCQKHNIISLLIALISIFIIFLIAYDECTNCFRKLKHTELELHETLSTTPKFWVYGRKPFSGFLSNVFLVLSRLGYEYGSNETEWDLLWAHDYPFTALQDSISKLKPHQKVNHFPGSGYITTKVGLATSGLKYVPAAFKLPRDKEKLLKFAEENPGKEFVEKDNHHRNITLKSIDDIDLETEGMFVQEFVKEPLLVSGYKFDIGIYTIITSVDPLRVYIYNEDALLRFCPEKYYPFDAKILDKYVVGDDYLPTWNIPDLTHYYKTLGFGMKESLNAYLKSKNKNPQLIWDQIEESLRITILKFEPHIINALRRYPSKRNFFEMMRFDFVVDENLNVFLMEANMSPNLSSEHFPPNKLLFEQVIYSLFRLVGIARLLPERDPEAEDMITADKNIAVFSTECNSVLCKSSCVSPLCHLCRQCITSETRTDLIKAYREHINRGGCKRIFPPPMDPKSPSLPDLEEYLAENQFQYKWFYGKCLQDPSWCT